MSSNFSYSRINYLPKQFNDGWTYQNNIQRKYDGSDLLFFLTNNYKHSSKKKWEERLSHGEIKINNKTINESQSIYFKDIISWNREPWEEESIPSDWEVIFDNGDMLVINKPSGLPVVPGGGFLKHTLCELLRSKSILENESTYPKPVHRLGRFTSGVLLCARRKETRSKLSSLLNVNNIKNSQVRKIYRGLAHKNKDIGINQYSRVNIPIKKYPHDKLDYIWSWSKGQNNILKDNDKLNSLSALTIYKVIERRKNSDLLEIIIKTGRPHQIRIHLASIGTPLIGDPLYQLDSVISQSSTPGEGGYLLHAHKLENIYIDHNNYNFEADPPNQLKVINE